MTEYPTASQFRQLTPRRGLNGDHHTTYVLQFGHYCGASPLDKLRGRGMWDLMTADEYTRGVSDNGRTDWYMNAPRSTPPAALTAWVSALAGYPVTLTRSDDLADPDWAKVAYRVRRAS